MASCKKIWGMLLENPLQDLENAKDLVHWHSQLMACENPHVIFLGNMTPEQNINEL